LEGMCVGKNNVKKAREEKAPFTRRSCLPASRKESLQKKGRKNTSGAPFVSRKRKDGFPRLRSRKRRLFELAHCPSPKRKIDEKGDRGENETEYMGLKKYRPFVTPQRENRKKREKQREKLSQTKKKR